MIIQEALKLGAYDLKKYANRNLAVAFGIAVGLTLLLLFGGEPVFGAEQEEVGENIAATGPVTLEDFEEMEEPPEVTEEVPPVEPLAPPPPPAAAVDADLGTGSEGRMGDINLTTDEIEGPAVADMDEISFASNLGGGDGGAETFDPDFEIDEEVDLRNVDTDPIVSKAPDYPEFIPNGQSASYNPGELNSNVVYPDIARENGQEGSVVFMVFLSKTGKVDKVDVLKADGVFTEAARKAIYKTTFTPARQNGVPISSRLKVQVKFRLD